MDDTNKNNMDRSNKDRSNKKLSSGHTIPCVGLGTWNLPSGPVIRTALDAAYKAGYRHIDTAKIYGNEKDIGEWLKDKNRSEIFITTKLWCTDTKRVEAACRESMEKLGVQYIDLYLIHIPFSPDCEFDMKQVWGDMEALVSKGLVRSIGVSNCGITKLKDLLSYCKIKPAVCQVEMHVYLPQDELRKYCEGQGIVLMSYSSLGSADKEPSVKKDPVVEKIARKHGKCPANVLLAYCLQLGCCVIPRSKSPEHIKTNFESLTLDDQDMKELRGITRRHRYITLEGVGTEEFFK